MLNNSTPLYLADGRWQGQHGIGRFATEVLVRLTNTALLTKGPSPLSVKNLIWQSYLLTNTKHQVYFNPGFNPVLFSSIPVVFTIHDLIHLQSAQPLLRRGVNKIFYEIVKKAAKKAYKIVTVSAYSKQTIIEWASLAPEKVVVVGSGVSHHFTLHGDVATPGFRYLLHVGNTKKHKNIERLISAFATSHISEDIKLVFTGQLTKQQQQLAVSYGCEKRVLSHQHLSELQLAAYYRGALGVVLPSLYEGFGLPVVEGMASGVPVLTSTVTSLPEVAGTAALLVDPYKTEAIASGIQQLVNDKKMRAQCIQQGLIRAQLFSWDKVAQKIQVVLDQAAGVA
jgi:glycosyltransferase involved in cell wall biosynthesis